MKTIAVGRKARDGSGAFVAIEQSVLPGKLSLPTIGHRLAVGGMLIAPGVLLALEAATRREFPLRFGGQFLAPPARIGLGILISDVNHRVLFKPVERRGDAQWT